MVELQNKRPSLSALEQEFYEFVFNKFASKISGELAIDSATIKSLFFTTGLAQKDLGQIWSLSVSKKKKNLDLEAFCLALKLIALRQNGSKIESLSMPELQKELPLPQFQMEEIQGFRPNISTEKKSEPSLPIIEKPVLFPEKPSSMLPHSTENKSKTKSRSELKKIS